ncbi:hypothetical protein BV20DRAFT_337379 [Pilatotrama ljubarskyi]|nr:hypothetical protein BV20DRAFT_337379 [Pilatotrama ljubarskyi]
MVFPQPVLRVHRAEVATRAARIVLPNGTVHSLSALATYFRLPGDAALLDNFVLCRRGIQSRSDIIPILPLTVHASFSRRLQQEVADLNSLTAPTALSDRDTGCPEMSSRIAITHLQGNAGGCSADPSISDSRESRKACCLYQWAHEPPLCRSCCRYRSGKAACRACK